MGLRAKTSPELGHLTPIFPNAIYGHLSYRSPVPTGDFLPCRSGLQVRLDDVKQRLWGQLWLNSWKRDHLLYAAAILKNLEAKTVMTERCQPESSFGLPYSAEHGDFLQAMHDGSKWRVKMMRWKAMQKGVGGSCADSWSSTETMCAKRGALNPSEFILSLFLFPLISKKTKKSNLSGFECGLHLNMAHYVHDILHVLWKTLTSLAAMVHQLHEYRLHLADRPHGPSASHLSTKNPY